MILSSCGGYKKERESVEQEWLEIKGDQFATLHIADPVALALANDLRTVNGIEEVLNVQKHSMVIAKAALYDWETLRPGIMAAAKRHRFSARSSR